MNFIYKSILTCVFSLLFFLPVTASAYGHYTVFSTVPADVYVDNEYSATISATQTLKLILSGPKSYVIGVRAKENGQTYKESVNVGANLNEHREIRAFSNPELAKTEITVYSQIPADVYIDNVLNASIDATQPLAINLPGPHSYVFEVRAKASNLIYREEVSIDNSFGIKKEIRAFSENQPQISPPIASTTVVATPQGGISREEMANAIHEATAKAKSEALAEEAARRSRAEKRAIANKGIAHLVGVEANRGLPSSVKNMERIKLLLEGLPSLKK